MSALKKINSKNFKKIQNITNPYGTGDPSKKILEILKTNIDEKLLKRVNLLNYEKIKINFRSKK